MDQQTARHFVDTVNVFTTPLPFYATQINYPFITSKILPNHNKGCDFSQSENPYTRLCSSSVESLLS